MLADYTSYTGNFATVAIQCLDKLSYDKVRLFASGFIPCREGSAVLRERLKMLHAYLQGNNKVAFNCDHHTFNYLIDGGYSEPCSLLLHPNPAAFCLSNRIVHMSSLQNSLTAHCKLRAIHTIGPGSIIVSEGFLTIPHTHDLL